MIAALEKRRALKERGVQRRGAAMILQRMFRAHRFTLSLKIRCTMGKKLKGVIWRWRMKMYFKFRQIGPRIIMDFMRDIRLKIDHHDAAGVSSLGSQAHRWHGKASKVKRCFVDLYARRRASAAILLKLIVEREDRHLQKAKRGKEHATKRLSLFQKQQNSGMAGAAKKSLDKDEIAQLLHLSEAPLPVGMPRWAAEGLAWEYSHYRRKFHTEAIKAYLVDLEDFRHFLEKEGSMCLAKAQVMDRIPHRDPTTGGPWRSRRFIDVYMLQESSFAPKPPTFGLAPCEAELDACCIAWGKRCQQHETQPDPSPGREEARERAKEFLRQLLGPVEGSFSGSAMAMGEERERLRREARSRLTAFMESETKQGVRILLSGGPAHPAA